MRSTCPATSSSSQIREWQAPALVEVFVCTHRPHRCRDRLTAILICRFLLDLQHANQKALDPALDDTHGDARGDQTLSLRFASRVLGSIGGSLPAAGHSTGAFEGSIDEEYVAEIQCGSDEGISGTEYSQDSGPGKV